MPVGQIASVNPVFKTSANKLDGSFKVLLTLPREHVIGDHVVPGKQCELVKDSSLPAPPTS